MAKVTSHVIHNDAILYILCMRIVHQTTPCAPSSNMRTCSMHLARHAQVSSWQAVQHASSTIILGLFVIVALANWTQ